MSDDSELLFRYAKERSEAAFAEIVRRHLSGVYSTALRRVGGDTHLAQDVAQQVFVALARKAEPLARHPFLTSWLYTATRNEAANLVRGEQRRKIREQEAHAMDESQPPATAGADWRQVAPVLDQVIDTLGENDRKVILLRFIEQRSFLQIGALLQVSEDAARMRNERALEKLRGGLARRGLTSTAGALAVAMSGQLGLAAPPGLTAAITTSAMAGTISAGGTGSLLQFLGFMTTNKLAGLVVGVIALAAIGFGVYEGKRAGREATTIAALTRRQADLQTRLQRLENPSEGPMPAKGPNSIFPSPPIGPLPQSAPYNRPSPQIGAMVPVKGLKDAGNDSPTATIESLNWARETGNIGALGRLLALSPAGAAQAEEAFTRLSAEEKAKYSISTPGEMVAFFLSGMGQKFSAVQQLAIDQPGEDQATGSMAFQRAEGGTSTYQFNLTRTADGWQWALPDTVVASVISYLGKNQSANSAPNP